MSFSAEVKLALSRAGVPSEEEGSFCLWAFGDGWETAPPSSAGNRWNELHGDLMHVSPTDSVVDTLAEMAKLYGERAEGIGCEADLA